MSEAAPRSTGWPAPAKLNLFLHVTGRRPDGYHELQTLFRLLDRGDSIDYRLRQDERILRCSEVAGVAPESDLAVRAARSLQQACGVAQGVEIHVHKVLPMGGGLGGGSSDAATTLVALNHLWGCGLERDELMRLGRGLGADVPVFVAGRTAWGEGVGERLTPVDLPARWYLVVQPPAVVSTAELFADPRLTRNSPALTIDDFFSGAGGNAFEPLVQARYPVVAAALEWLGARATARLTGTGACVFAPFETAEAAEQARAALPRQWQGFVARGVNESPLMARLRAAAGAGQV